MTDPRTPKTLVYDASIWREVARNRVHTLQLFITNRCNLRCRGCFYADRLGSGDMAFDAYCRIVESYAEKTLPGHEQPIGKVVLLGGEPSLHPDVERMVRFLTALGLHTTIYTNGTRLDRLLALAQADPRVTIRVGVHGVTASEKPLARLLPKRGPLTIVYMLRRDNRHELALAARKAEERFPDADDFYISSIRDILRTGDFWKDTDETIPNAAYAETVQRFLNGYRGRFRRLHLATRGILAGHQPETGGCATCRFGNIFPDGRTVICPMDISRNIHDPLLRFGIRPCNKAPSCVLQKIVLERILP